MLVSTGREKYDSGRWESDSYVFQFVAADYERVREPKKGATGVVECLQHRRCSQLFVAKKSLRDHVLTDVIVEEAAKQQGIRSPFVVRVFELRKAERSLILEFCPDGLDEKLKTALVEKHELSPWSETLQIVSQVAEGLSAAHRRGVIHGDIKPANVRMGQDKLWKLNDFGAARNTWPAPSRTVQVEC